MKKVLVTGATGFIGRPVVKELLAKGYNIHIVTSQPIGEINKALQSTRLNLMNSNEVSVFFQKNRFDAVLHLAWLSASGAKCHHADENIDWTIASLHLLKCFVEQGGRHFLGAGTMSEYDFSYGYLNEDQTPLESKFLYGQCKASLYRLGKAYCEQHGVDFKWARIFNLYGPYEKQNRLVPSVALSCLHGEDIKVSNCIKFQDYLHVFDAAKAIIQLLESEFKGAVNICSGAPIRLSTIVEKIVTLTGFKGKILWGAVPSYFEDLVVVGDHKRLMEQVGWKQEISLDEGLKMTIDWWRNHAA